MISLALWISRGTRGKEERESQPNRDSSGPRGQGMGGIHGRHCATCFLTQNRCSPAPWIVRDHLYKCYTSPYQCHGTSRQGFSCYG